MNAPTDAMLFGPLDNAVDCDDIEAQIESTLDDPDGRPSIPVTVEIVPFADGTGEAVAVQVGGVWIDAYAFSAVQRATWAAEYARQLQREAA